MSADHRIALRIPADDPCFAGHFEGRPLLPGAALLACYVLPALIRMRTAAGVDGQRNTLRTVQRLKFSAEVLPGEVLRLDPGPDPAAQRLGFQVWKGAEGGEQRLCASGVLMFEQGGAGA